MRLSDREIATVLAALREHQRALEAGGLDVDMDDIATNGGELEPLSAEEIDSLCERLNFSGSRTEPGPLECLLIEAVDFVTTIAHPEGGADPAELAPEAAKLEPRIRKMLNKRKRARKAKS